MVFTQNFISYKDFYNQSLDFGLPGVSQAKFNRDRQVTGTNSNSKTVHKLAKSADIMQKLTFTAARDPYLKTLLSSELFVIRD
jgi:hypothetical protein